MWFCDRSFEASGLIPEGFLEIDNFVRAGDHAALSEIVINLVFAFPEFFGINSPDIPENREVVRGLNSQFSCEELADMSWKVCKDLEKEMWDYIPRTGKYTQIFKNPPQVPLGQVTIRLRG